MGLPLRLHEMAVGQEVWVRAIVRVVDLQAARVHLEILGHEMERGAVYQRVSVPLSEIGPATPR